VIAAGDGKVVYSGTGLRGYGKLVIVKHNNTYLTAYAHNQNVLVKEGQRSARGRRSPKWAIPTLIRSSCTSRSGVRASRSIH
jgi:hypothetical protein